MYKYNKLIQFLSNLSKMIPSQETADIDKNRNWNWQK